MSGATDETLAYVAVGSNIDPEANTLAALDALASRVRVTDVSTFYRTEPIGAADQPPFVNGVWEIRTDHDPLALKTDVLAEIEAALGRVRGADRYAPRTIDLDLVLYGGVVRDDDALRLPHPDVTRPFVGVPLVHLVHHVGDPAARAALQSALSRAIDWREWLTSTVIPGRPLVTLTDTMKERVQS